LEFRVSFLAKQLKKVKIAYRLATPRTSHNFGALLALVLAIVTGRKLFGWKMAKWSKNKKDDS